MRNDAQKKPSGWQGARINPLVRAVYNGASAKSEAPVDGVAKLFGVVRAGELVERLTRIDYRSTRCDNSNRRRTGKPSRWRSEGVHGKRFTAKPELRATPLRTALDHEVRGPCALFLVIAGSMRTGSKAIWHKSMWLGRRGPAKHAGGLASRFGVTVRTIERWLAALRLCGVLKNWQPPAKSAPATARTRRGRAYSKYELVGELPRELRTWQEGRPAVEANEAATVVLPDQVTAPPPFDDLAALRAELDARVSADDG